MAKKRSNLEVVNAYLNGEEHVESHTGNLWIDGTGKRLMNYSTCLVERNAELGLMIINRTSYSNSTSKIQSYIIGQLWQKFGGEWIEENTISIDNAYGGGNYGGGVSYLEEYAKEKIEWSKGLHDYNIVNYFDVWGNKKDGWEINNTCKEESILTIHENATDKEVYQALKNVGFFNKYARITQVDIDSVNEFGWEFTQKKDGKPLCRVELIEAHVTIE